MIKPAKNQNFSRHKPNTLRLKIIKPHLLQSNYLPRFNVTSPKNTTVCTLANLSKRKRKKTNKITQQNMYYFRKLRITKKKVLVIAEEISLYIT